MVEGLLENGERTIWKDMAFTVGPTVELIEENTMRTRRTGSACMNGLMVGNIQDTG